MKDAMSMMELHKVMGDRIRISLSEMEPEKRREENEQTKIIEKVAKQMINNAKFVLETEKMLAQAKDLKESKAYELIGD